MNFSSYIEFLKRLILSIPFNVFDYIVFATLFVYILEDIYFGLVAAFIGFASTIGGFFIGLLFYPQVSNLLIEKFALTKGISDAVSFLLVSAISFTFLSALLSILRKKYLLLRLPKKLDAIGGAIFGTASFFFIASFAVALLLSFPVSGLIKNSIRESVTGRFLFTKTQGLEGQVRHIFGGAIEEMINFLTVKPGSSEILELNFKTISASVDKQSEQEMLIFVNEERKKVGLAQLQFDEETARVGRAHAKDMLERGYFSHYTPEGLSPFDRLEEAGILYQFAGENLALAPDAQIAMDGLMQSQGHRENILSPNFRKVGIGVIDAGIFGKMFVQEFTD